MENVKEIYLCDNDLNLVATIRDFEKFEWTEKFYEADVINITMSFKIEKDKKSELYSYYKSIYETLESINNESEKTNNVKIIYIFADNSRRIGFVENFSIDEKEESLEIKGRGVLSLFEKRFFPENIAYEPKEGEESYLGVVMCKILREGDKEKDENGIYKYKAPFRVFEIIDENNKNGKRVYAAAKEGDSIYKRICDLAETYELGISFYLDERRRKIVFKTVESETIKNAVSSDDGNLVNNVYKCDLGKYANYCQITGDSYKDGNKEIDIKEIIDESYLDGEKFKIHKKSKSKLKDFSDNKEKYREALRSEAREELSKSKIEESYDIEITDDVAIEVGNKILVKLDVGYKEIMKATIVSSIKHTYGKDGYKRDIGFGKPIDMAYELKRKIFTDN